MSLLKGGRSLGQESGERETEDLEVEQSPSLEVPTKRWRGQWKSKQTRFWEGSDC